MVVRVVVSRICQGLRGSVSSLPGRVGRGGLRVSPHVHTNRHNLERQEACVYSTRVHSFQGVAPSHCSFTIIVMCAAAAIAVDVWFRDQSGTDVGRQVS